MLRGSCLCQGVAFEIDGRVKDPLYCHCAMCRKSHGTAFRARAKVLAREFRWTRGESLVRYYQSSPGTHRGFCSACGSNLVSKFDDQPAVYGLALGVLDDDPQARALCHVHVASKAPWFDITDDLPQYEAMPPGPVVAAAAQQPQDDPLRQLARYSAWANALLHDVLSGLDEGTLARPRPGRPAGVLGVLGHLYVVGKIWQGHLTGQAHGFTSRNLEPLPSLAELRQLQETLDRWYLEFSCALDPARRTAPIDFRFVDGGPGRMTAQEMLLHVANHGTYHRGYIADMLYEEGLKPPKMDLPVFIRDAGA